MKDEDHKVRAEWLVPTSVTLAILLEVLPVEADFSYGHLFGFPTRVQTILSAKLVCVAMILAPLAIYYVLNGYRGLRHARGRVIAVCLIVLLRFILDLYAIISILSGSAI